MGYLTTNNRDITSLQPVAQVAARLFFYTCEEKGIEVFATEYYRSQERQDYLYCKGRTIEQCVDAGINREFAIAHANPDLNIVTKVLNSIHTKGLAWDIATKGAELYNIEILNRAGEVASELGIEWGGNWTTFLDRPHFQIDPSWTEPSISVEKEPVISDIRDITIQINNELKSVSSINVGGHEYVKLRDLATDLIHIDYKDVPIINFRG